MLIRQTIVHEHRRTADRHFDWMIDDPADLSRASTRELVTFRLPVGPAMWPVKPIMQIVALPPHRRAYLTLRANHLSDGRGQVRVADRGRVMIRRWTASHRILEVELRDFAGIVTLSKSGGGEFWQMQLLSPTMAIW